jgi:hypothetical protein
VGNLAARNNAWVPVVWIVAVAPGVICGWLLFGPRLPTPSRQVHAPGRATRGAEAT